ncbi:DUF1194 domain-containing protein [Methylobacterium longum]|uniref:DUF1194 domain-containing protein n=1 Tax=Methylobacterium longum TaxID=767694 RepID=A0ABT8AHV6_9HYPH|nr:DUF1194 domain-containing protein [Methylobacterium longum]MDN3569268.1 DUF1194 domain-containing protein [Methylobacterium longum]GJE14271.1 hypothetical protein FOHLNKBM_5344 [Methylobacterium longum]
MRLAVVTASLFALVLPVQQERAQEAGKDVDLALVFAVDISLSMDPEEQRVQREGYVAAFRSEAVQSAIRQGLIGRIAVTYVEWAGVGSRYVVVPWTLIGTAAEAEGFAGQLTRARPKRAIWTSVSAALDFSVELLRVAGVEPTRRVIDVSGDGPNNQGREVTQARDDAVAAGIVINGLPLMISAPTGPYDIPDLDLYYRDCVIGGPGAFMVPVRDVAEFATAIRTKIVREVADAAAPAQPIVPAQAFSRARCAITGRRGGDFDP